MKKSSQKKQNGKIVRESAGAAPCTGEGEVIPLTQEWVRITSLRFRRRKQGGSQLIVSVSFEKLEAGLEWRDCGKSWDFKEISEGLE